MKYNIRHFAELLDLVPVIRGNITAINDLVIDTRKVVFPKDACFFALPGTMRDGHTYIPVAYRMGIRNFIVSDSEQVATLPDANYIVVDDVIGALQRIGAYHRKRFSIPLIGITGSHGKTIIKEWLYELISPDYSVYKSPKSYNSQIGVPLSVWGINAAHGLAIIEAGISQPGEMKTLEKIIQPTMGILSHIGAAHDEGFLSRDNKIEEKLNLFARCNQLIYRNDIPLVSSLVLKFKADHPTLELLGWGQNPGGLVEIIAIEYNSQGTSINYKFNNDLLNVFLPFTDTASVENALYCLVTMLALGINAEICRERLARLSNIPLRLELKKAHNNCILVYDCYNTDIESLRLALDFLNQQSHSSNKTAILSEILQSGMDDSSLYHEMADLLSSAGINRVLGIGKKLEAHIDIIKSRVNDTLIFEDTRLLLKQLPEIRFQDEAILLKGARKYEFERIGKMLESKAHETRLEINLSAMAHNLKAYQSKLLPDVKTMVMVKAFSYGTGSYEIANMLQFNQVDYLAVAYTDEGVDLREAGVQLPIVVMNPSPGDFDRMIQASIEPNIFSFDMLDRFLGYINQAGLTDYKIHLKIDTGMHRLGFSRTDIEKIAGILSRQTRLKVASLFSHLAASEDPNHDQFSKQQIEQFKTFSKELKKSIGYSFDRHILNSSGLLRFPEAQMEMVRIGIGLYGYDATGLLSDKLKAISTLKTSVSQIRAISKEESIGYGRAGRLGGDGKIAIVSIGYADGLPIQLSNGTGHMLVHGKPAPIVGNICMDMTMLDISGIKGVKVGDDVIVFGEELPITQLAQWAQTIPYDILTGISQRVKRIYFDE